MTPPRRAAEQAQSDRRSLKRRFMRAFGIFTLVQSVVAGLVIMRARRTERRRALSRPNQHNTRTFEPVKLESGEDSAAIYMDSDSFTAAIIEAIDGASKRVLIETFIWMDDAAGREVRDALSRAVERGVACHVIWDWALSSKSLEHGFFHPDVVAFPFRPIRLGAGALAPSNLFRDHRKIVCVDSTHAFVGGYNFGTEYYGWRDTHVQIIGLSARDVENAFVDFWNQHRALHYKRLNVGEQRSWDPHVLVHRNDPSLAIFPIRGMYMEALDRAEERAWLTTAYFVPDRAFRNVLMDAARRGVDVRVMLPARSNHPLTDVMAHGMFEELMASGVRIFLYRDFMVHAKTAVIDNTWVTIGTANLDRWSMLGNYEINLEIRSEKLASQMIEMFELDGKNATEIDLDTWRRRPLKMRASETILRSLAPLM